MEGRSVGHNFERNPPKDHPCQVWFNLVQKFQRRRFKCKSLRHTTDGRWTPSDGKSSHGCHDMTEILLKVALNTIDQTIKMLMIKTGSLFTWLQFIHLISNEHLCNQVFSFREDILTFPHWVLFNFSCSGIRL